ncbi:phage holin family protein [Clostridium sp. D2Q-11]|uniref:Phage holin family protein n=1 Tax=Anaeromonas frigoriresistens TaxID=2683708 RepID=A0A942UVH5_9FIRM|nr:phage holin family protein [Anaeromonas frigoriresistens]MBS4538800.1 phage holin family protein [Anaeromonas frigoriresistens]
MSIGKLIIKIIVAALAIAIATFFTPGMSNEGGIWSLILAAIVIGILDWAILKFTNIDASPFGRGFVGFIVAAAILYITGMIVEGFTVTIFGAIIGALILGVVDIFIPEDKKAM